MKFYLNVFLVLFLLLSFGCKKNKDFDSQSLEITGSNLALNVKSVLIDFDKGTEEVTLNNNSTIKRRSLRISDEVRSFNDSTLSILFFTKQQSVGPDLARSYVLKHKSFGGVEESESSYGDSDSFGVPSFSYDLNIYADVILDGYGRPVYVSAVSVTPMPASQSKGSYSFSVSTVGAYVSSFVPLYIGNRANITVTFQVTEVTKKNGVQIRNDSYEKSVIKLV